MYYIFNGKLLEGNQKVSTTPISDGAMYGYGLFETIKVKNSKAIFLDEHLKRLREGLEELGIVFLYSDEKVKEMIEFLIKKNSSNGALKLAVIKNKNISDLVIMMRDSSYSLEQYKKGMSLKISDVLRNSTSKIIKYKTLNYFENFLEFKNAKLENYDEVIFFNEKGFLAEGAISNIFMKKDNKLYTPSVQDGILNGIIRTKVFEFAEIEIVIGKITKEFLSKADEIFITNSLMEIMPVRSIEQINFECNDFKVAIKLKKELDGEDKNG